MAANKELMLEFVGILRGKLSESETIIAQKAINCLHDDAHKACSEITRLKAKVNLLVAENRDLKAQLSEPRESRGVLGEVGRLFGV